MEIRKPDFETKEILDYYLSFNEYRGCELTTGNSLFWCDFYNTKFVIMEDMLVFGQEEQGALKSLTFPIGEHNPKYAFDKMVDYFEESNLPFTLYLVQPEMFAQIEAWYPGMYQISYDRDAADYLYTFDTLAGLSGKKLHAKRNHINRFLENYPDYEYERINGKNWESCLPLLEAWEDTSSDEHAEEKLREQEIIRYALRHRKRLGMTGALIRVQGRVVAFTMGEPLTKDTFVIHFEKAYADVQGAYAMINREFVRRELPAYQYINREEDMGIPGLRQAKLSYQPVCLVEKGTVTRIPSEKAAP